MGLAVRKVESPNLVCHSDGPLEVLLSGSHSNKYIEGVPARAATVPHADVQYVAAGRLPSNHPAASYRHPSHKETKS